MRDKTVTLHTDRRGVSYVKLNRPEVHNAMDGRMVDEARQVFAGIDRDISVRVVVLSGAGASFCAGGDFRYQQEQRTKPRAVQVSEAQKLAFLLNEIDVLTKPVIAQVNGPAYGGGVGLICACDIAVAVDDAKFALTETRLGILPGMTAPYIVEKIGAPRARRLMLNARPFTAAEAVGFGMLDDAVAKQDLAGVVEEEVQRFLACAPGAVAATKALVSYVATHRRDESMEYTVDRVADMWASPEAEEGMRGFLEKRRTSWDKRD